MEVPLTVPCQHRLGDGALLEMDAVHTYFCSCKFLLEIVCVWFISVVRARGVLEVSRFRTTTFSMRRIALVCVNRDDDYIY